MEATRFMRKPFFVTGYLITEENMADVARWCEGHIVKDTDNRSFVRVPVNRPTHDLQTKGYVGMWVLLSQKQGKRTYKVYDQEWLDKNFIEMDPEFSDHEIPDEPKNKRAGKPSGPTPHILEGRRGVINPNRLPRAMNAESNGSANRLAQSA